MQPVEGTGPAEERPASNMAVPRLEAVEYRSRSTWSIAEPFISDIRVNYEKYFYNEGATPKVSEQDKAVIEFMIRF